MPSGIYNRTEKIKKALKLSWKNTRANRMRGLLRASKIRKMKPLTKRQELANFNRRGKPLSKSHVEAVTRSLNRPSVIRKMRLKKIGKRNPRSNAAKAAISLGHLNSLNAFTVNLLKQILLPFGYKYECKIGKIKVDFACLDSLTVIEVDGTSHKTRGARIKDMKRDKFLHTQGWRVIRVRTY